jgi:preprotein translocase SecF subunit
MEFLKNTNFDFMGKRKIAYAFSTTIIVLGLIMLIVRGGFNFNIDFSGGTVIEMEFGKTYDIGKVRSIVGSMGVGNAEIQTIGSDKTAVMIRFKEAIESSNVKEDVAVRLINAFRTEFPEEAGYKIETLKSEKVGPKIGSELKGKALKAILLSFLGILIYVGFRFQFKFGIGAVIALIHDVLVTLSIFVIFNQEIGLTVVAALLTIVGYSINDTIVISDRIRENMKVMFKKPLMEICNISLNQTLSRTIITSFTTLVVVLCMFLIGGKATHEFSFALLVGILFGTYSSVFIVTPIVVGIDKMLNKKPAK